MKYLIYFSILSVFFFNQSSFATSPRKNTRLEDFFIKPNKDLSWMTEKERGAYVTFLHSLSVLIEADLMKNHVVIIADEEKKTSRFNWLFPYLIEEAEAAFPLVPIVIGTAIRSAGTRAVTTYASRTSLVKDVPWVEVVPAARSGMTWAKVATGVSVVSTAAAVPAVVSQDSSKEEHKQKAPEAKEVPKGIAATTPAATSSAPAAISPEEKPMAGMFCIFGGHAGEYKTVSGITFCPSPKEFVNNSLCDGTVKKPNFLCQSFGLSEHHKQKELSKKLCVSLHSKKGLEDLTVRCSEAFKKEFIPVVKSLDAQALEEVQSKIKEGLQALETKKGIRDVGFLQYCENNNAFNSSLQAEECNALKKVVDDLRKDFPSLVNNAEKIKQLKAPATGSKAAPGKK